MQKKSIISNILLQRFRYTLYVYVLFHAAIKFKIKGRQFVFWFIKKTKVDFYVHEFLFRYTKISQVSTACHHFLHFYFEVGGGW